MLWCRSYQHSRMSGAADYADTDHNHHQPPPAERRPPRPHVIKTALGAFLSLFLINFIVPRLSSRAALQLLL